jgi:hypothetical protein
MIAIVSQMQQDPLKKAKNCYEVAQKIGTFMAKNTTLGVEFLVTKNHF